jgi:hypothetical protein
VAEIKLLKSARAKYFKPKQNVSLGQEKGKWGLYTSPYTIPEAILGFDLENLSLGDYYQMRDDPQISASLNTISFFLHQLDYDVKCDDPAIAAFTEEALRFIWTPLIRTISTALWSGHAPATFVYGMNKDKYIQVDRVRDLAPWSCEVFVGTTQEEKDAGLFKGIKQGADIIDPMYCFYYPFMREFGDWKGRKLLRAAYPAYFNSLIAHMFIGRYYEAFGMATRVGRYPAGETVKQTINGVQKDADAAEVMEDVVSKQRNYSVITLPSDRDENGNFLFDIELLESKMRGVEMEKWLQRLDTEKTLAVFTPQLLYNNSSGGSGSYNLGQEQKATFLTMLNAIVGDMEFYINNYFLKRLAQINFGVDCPLPTMKSKPFSRAQEQQLAMIINALIQNHYADDFGLDMGALIKDIGSSLGLKVETMDALTEKGVADRKSERVKQQQELMKQNGLASPVNGGQAVPAKGNNQNEQQQNQKTKTPPKAGGK